MFQRRNQLQKQKKLEEELEELRAWKARAEAVLDKIQLQNLELSSEVQTSVRKASEISQRSYGMKQRLQTFETHFEESTQVVGRMDEAVDTLVAGVNSTHAAISQTSAAIEQISASIVRISEVSTTRLGDVQELEHLSQSGQKEMTSTLLVIQEVTKGIDDLQTFLSVINTIASQTRILAMNAAIQAAHAGEYGQSFAVVADEVRQLAETSAANASQVSKKLKSWITSIRKAETSSQATAQLFSEVEQKTKATALSFHEIEQGTRELALGGKEILQGIANLREVAQSTSQESEHLRVGSQQMSEHLSALLQEETRLKNEIFDVREAAKEVNLSATTLTKSTIRQLSTTQQYLSQGDSPVHSKATILVLQHLSWLTRIRGVLDGTVQLRPEQVSDHHQCDLGQWMDTAGKAVLPPGVFQTLNQDHERLHALARDITRLTLAGQHAEGEKLYSDLNQVSLSIIQQIQAQEGLLGSGELIKWTSDFALGVDAVDRQHQKLVRLLNDLHHSFLLGGNRGELASILEELANYTQTHFHDEEQLFMPTAYPGKTAHLAKHQDFIQQITKFRQDFESGVGSVGSEILVFLKDWLVQHIQGTDRGYATYVNKHRGDAA